MNSTEIISFIFSPNQSRPNNADIFLLLLNNASRSFRKEFELQDNLSNIMNHRFQKKSNDYRRNSSNIARLSMNSIHASPMFEKVKS